MAKRRRKTKTHLKGGDKEIGTASASSPKSFVIRSGKVSTGVGNLVSEVRQVMEPNTASRLRERKSNKLRDFLTMCGPLGVSHMLLFSQKMGNINLRIARTPRGPTVTFRVNKFALCRDVAKAQRRMRATGGEYNTAPLLVLNNFGSAEKHVKLLVSVFQGLFPPIHVQTMALSQARRIVLLHYNEATQTIEWRHYLISVRPVGVSKRVRRVIEGSSNNRNAALTSSTSKKIPNLSSARDISEYLLGSQGGGAQDAGFETDASSASEADSDVEEGGKASNHVQLPDSYIGRGNVRDSQRAVRLVELGPRMELRCVKIEEGIPGAGKEGKGNSSGGNDVLWHDYVQKSSTESNKQRKALVDKDKERKKRREIQEENVRRKKEENEALKTSKRGKQRKEEDDGKEDDDEAQEVDSDDEDDEFAYEDMHGEKGEDAGKEVLFEEDDERVDDDDSVGEESEEEIEDEEDDDDHDHDESDLSPIEVGFKDLDSESEEESAPKKKPKGSLQKR
ncbi:hypothetical protein CBS101457_006784 [Exobasidium rhododendri]|nr:hypothetical protein CBS101457_006784 [Exobasidium rhododendri]